MPSKRIAVSLAASAAVLLAAAAVATRSFPLHAATTGDHGDGRAVTVGAPGGVAGAPKRAPERKLVFKVDPAYPQEAKKDKIEGVVVLGVTIEKSGEVTKVDVVKGPAALREAAAAAVRQWRYEPSDIGPTLATITVRFILDKDKGKARQ